MSALSKGEPTWQDIMDSLPQYNVKTLDDLHIRKGYVMYEFVANNMTKSGIHLPTNTKNKSAYGVVIKVNDVEGISVGDILLIHFAKDSFKLKIEDQPYRHVMVSREDNHIMWTSPDNFLGHE